MVSCPLSHAVYQIAMCEGLYVALPYYAAVCLSLNYILLLEMGKERSVIVYENGGIDEHHF